MTDPSPEPRRLDRPADTAVLRELGRAGLLKGPAYVAALELARPPRAWWLWTSRMLLLLGAAFILIGIISFFAANWAALGHFAQFGLIEAALAASAVGAVYLTKDKLGGKVLLLAAFVFVGVLLAVYGQTYQTGADAYELFLAWAALGIGFVVIADFAGLWILWLVVLETGIFLYWMQVVDLDLHHYEPLCLVLAAVNSLALAAREFGLQSGREWLSGRWTRLLLLAAALAALMVPTVALIFEPAHGTLPGAAAAVLWLIALGLAVAVYFSRIPDLAALALAVFSLSVIITIGAGRIWAEITKHEVPLLLGIGTIVIIITVVAVLLLRRLGRALAERPHV